MAFSGTNVGVFKNGLMISTSGMNVGTCTFNLTSIGCLSPAGVEASFFVGFISEIVIYNSGCDGAAITGIENYLSSKYNIALAR
jgi:hypothetical protein